MADNPLRCEDEKFDRLQEALALKMEELGVAPTVDIFLELIKDWWYGLNDDELINGYIAQQKAAKLEAVKKAKEAELAVINQQIADLQS